MDYLYKDFLENASVYDRATDFWKSVVNTLLSAENQSYHDYLTVTRKDGSLYRDGNPIFHFQIEGTERAVRIIQEEAETDGVEIAAWLDKIDSNGATIHELIISLELTRESAFIATDLINAWAVNQLTKDKMERYINKALAIRDLVMA